MKTYTTPRFAAIILAFILLSFGDPYTIKRISDKDFRYEFYTTDKKIKPITTKTYYWFKGGLIHEAQGGIAGDLLDDKFTKIYHSNQLAEQGQFKEGLRVGLWKTWYPNGVLATRMSYSKGLRSGKYFRYDENGKLIENGKFSTGLKTGKWTNAETKEITTYKKGVIVKKKETFTKSEKYRIKQEHIKLENSKDTQKELEATSDAAKLTALKAKTKEEKALAKEKAKKNAEAEAAAKKAQKAAKKAAKNQPKKDSKVETFFKNLFKKKDKAPKNG
ncbi:toxin-antitoxin system YwqK family antitoxin [Flavobacterium sp. LAR06]|uniref:toxin-antitoxin system YwqK family antitoxin n=1 Tax=Flavobacterium sp. LAR06 TaxID=3064897 RepID=UPI0035C034D0